MKNLFAYLVSLVVLAALMSGQVLAQTIKLGTLAPEGSVWYVAVRDLAEEWKRISNGAITVRIYPGGVAGDGNVMVQKMRVGQLQAAALTAGGLSSIAAEMKVFNTPMLIRSDEELDFVRTSLEPELEALAEAKGFKLLAWSDVGWLYLFSKTAVRNPDDARRLKMWTSAGDATWEAALKDAGYRPVALPPTEIHMGLQSGLIEALAAPPVMALSSQWFGVAKHMTDFRWAPLIGALVISAKAWEKFPAEIRPQLLEAARRITAKAQDEVRRFESEAIAAMQAYGLEVHAVSQEAAEIWEREIRDTYPKIIGRSIPADIYHEVTAQLESYRSIP